MDADAKTGENNGTSWDHAFTQLQAALAAATAGAEIWVAEGTYKPTSRADRSATFQLVSGAALYGGFAATVRYRNRRFPVPDQVIGWSVWVANFFDDYVEIRAGDKTIATFEL